MKKILSFILVLAMLTSLAACGTSNNGSETTTTATTTAEPTTAATTTAEPTTAATTTAEPTTAATTTAEPTTEVTTTTAPSEPADSAAIKTAEDFAAMKPDGEYYLANDITISATWNGGVNVSATYADNIAFTGILDGKGHTITTSAALFANLQGTVKDLTVVGEIAEVKIADTVIHNAAVAIWTNGTAHFENVTTKANITGGKSCGGLLGYGATGSSITAINCVNDGNITCTDQVGGMFGYIQDNNVTITDCTNNGNLVTANYGGGILGRFGRDKASVANGSLATITGCTNTGSVTGAKGQTGGILGYLVGGAVITDCVNKGEIINTAGIAGGIFGSHGNFDGTCSLEVVNCTNTGIVRGITLVGGIAGRLGRAPQADGYAFRIENCVNAGDVYATSAEGTTGAIQAAGIAGYAYGGTKLPNGVVNCINTGNIIVDNKGTGNVNVGGIVGYVNSANFEAQNNINAGEITFTGNNLVTIALIIYNKNADATGIFNNYSVAVGEAAAVLIAETPVAAEASGTVVTADQLASGEAAYLLNKAAGEVIFYQAIGTDALPTLVKGENNTVYKATAGGYTNVAADGTLELDTPAETSAAQ